MRKRSVGINVRVSPTEKKRVTMLAMEFVCWELKDYIFCHFEEISKIYTLKKKKCSPTVECS